MRRVVILSAALLGVLPAAANQAVGKTFLTNTRDMLFQVTSPMRLTFDRDDRMHLKDDSHEGDISATGFYVQSSDEQALRDYFLPVLGKTSLIAGEVDCTANTNIATNPGTPRLSSGVDVVANYFNVLTAGVDGVTDLDNLTFQDRKSVV